MLLLVGDMCFQFCGHPGQLGLEAGGVGGLDVVQEGS